MSVTDEPEDPVEASDHAADAASAEMRTKVAAPAMMNVMWRLTAIDVERTLQQVCDLLLKVRLSTAQSLRFVETIHVLMP
eukprot:SAG31_NODE_20751_length_566_cov_0.775161_1_plen_79_part_10